jgi:hypothetical protein
LIANATETGFLFHGPLTKPAPDTDDRPVPDGHKYGTMFGNMTAAMKWPEPRYRKRRVMHSIRHTVAFMFSEMRPRMPLEIRGKIMAHFTTVRDAGQMIDEGGNYGRGNLLDWMVEGLNYPAGFRADSR